MRSGRLPVTQTRCYHGLLVAALQPPLGRTLLVAKLDETAQYGGRALRPGHKSLGWRSDSRPTVSATSSDFILKGAVPVWTFAVGGCAT